LYCVLNFKSPLREVPLYVCVCVQVSCPTIQFEINRPELFGDPDWLIDAETWPSANMIDKYV